MARQLGLNPPISVRELIRKAEDSPVGSWVSIGPTRIKNAGLGAGGRLSAIAIDPKSPSTIYVGAEACGVWKTTDAGGSWQPVTDGLPTLAIAAIAVDPSESSRVYVATVGAGVFRSDDAGKSWTQISGDVAGGAFGRILLVHPRNPSLIYLTSDNGVHRSDDSGRTWPVSKGGGRAFGLAMDPSNPDVLYAAIGQGIYKTTNGGVPGQGNWSLLTNGLPTAVNDHIELALCREVPRSLYAGYSYPGAAPRSWRVELYRTDDGGSSWSLRQSTGVGDKYHEVIGVDPNDPQVVYFGGVNFWRSDDGGNTFTVMSGPHDDQHAFAADPVTPGVIYELGDGGIYQSPNRGNSWSFCGEGIANVEFFDVANATTDPSLVIGGTQDNGTIRYNGSSTVWQDMYLAGDGATVDIDPTKEQILYGMYQYVASISRSTNGGQSWTNIAGGLPGDSACGQAYFQVHPTSPTTLLACCKSLWRTTSPGSNWSQIFTPQSGNIVRSAVDPTVDLYYAGSDDGRLYAGPSGANWLMVFTHPSSSGVSDITVDLDTLVVYVSFGATGTGRVFRLVRTSPAPSTMAATDITFNLPNGRAVQAIAVDRNTALSIYAGTDRGVYRGSSVDNGTTWSWMPYNYGLPPASVVDLEVHPTSGVMRAATYGRSAFEVRTK